MAAVRPTAGNTEERGELGIWQERTNGREQEEGAQRRPMQREEPGISPGEPDVRAAAPDSQEDLLWKSWLAAIWEIPGAKRERLIETAGSIRGVYNMKKQHIDKMDMLTEREKGILDGARKRAPQEALEALLHAQAGLVTVLDEAYPRLLRDIPAALLPYTIPAACRGREGARRWWGPGSVRSTEGGMPT